MNDVILALNAGSSSLKFGLFNCPASGEIPFQIALGVARPGTAGSYQVRVSDRNGVLMVDETWPGTTVDELARYLWTWLDDWPDVAKVAAVGHRIVHGGAGFGDPIRIDEQILKQLEALIPLAPLHQPACLKPVQILRELKPELVQVACFDTAFHRGISPPASRYALPRKFEAQGIRRYGFHGLSFESVAAQIAEEKGYRARDSRIIIAHLGSGASLCALRGLQSVDTTMGFSALDGLVMGTRPGSLDPGILLYLLKELGLSVDQLEHLLYRESGLLGVSGISSAVETLLASDAPSADEALELFAFQVARQSAALAATLGGLDRFVFTGGIGENSAAMRSKIVGRLGLFGAKLDEGANFAGERTISSEESSILIEWRATQEERIIASHVSAQIEAQSARPGLN